MIVGRFVAGLPFELANSAVLPRFFPQIDDEVDQCVQLCFPCAPLRLTQVCRFLLATLVYNGEYLQRTLPLKYPLFKFPLFRNPEVLSSLQLIKVSCSCSTAHDSIRPSGIPPHIGILVALGAVENGFKCCGYIYRLLYYKSQQKSMLC